MIAIVVIVVNHLLQACLDAKKSSLCSAPLSNIYLFPFYKLPVGLMHSIGPVFASILSDQSLPVAEFSRPVAATNAFCQTNRCHYCIILSDQVLLTVTLSIGKSSASDTFHRNSLCQYSIGAITASKTLSDQSLLVTHSVGQIADSNTFCRTDR